MEQVTNVQGKITPGTVHVCRMKQYYHGDEQLLDSLVTECEPEETHNDNISSSDSEGSDSAISMPKDLAESENSTKILELLDNTPNGKESLNWDTKNDHNDDAIHLESNDIDVGFAPCRNNLPPEDIYYIEDMR